MKNITIAVDAMGGDHGPTIIVPAALRAVKNHPALHLILVGDAAVLRPLLQQKAGSKHPRLTIHHTAQTVTMDESPSLALRNKKDSSMRVAINLVKENSAGACVSAGNTGALMAIARYVLKTLPGIDRPAILSAIPSLVEHHTEHHKKTVRMLDLGANVDSTAEHLLQFAVMGSVLASAVDNIARPRVCLLNIGAEAIKGNELVKAAALLLAQSPLNYTGFIEGNDIYQGHADVIVCDGFVGNVALKTAEGVATSIGRLMKAAFKYNGLTRLAGLIALPVLKSVAKKINPEQYNGASLIGLQGIVIKSHGSASIQGFVHAIEEAMMQVEKNIPERIRAEVEALLQSVTSNPTKDDNDL